MTGRHTPVRREPALTLLPGALLGSLVAWLLATGRWGAYVGLARRDVYISEIGIVLSVLTGVLVLRTQLLRPWPRWPRLVTVGLTTLFTWSVVRLLTGHLDTTALRDAAPYLYVVIIGIVWAVGTGGRRWTRGALAVGMTLHAGWLLLALRAGSVLPTWHLGPTYAFAIRDDFDSTVSGIAVAVALVRAAQRSETRRLRAAWTVIGLLNLAVILQLRSRAGFLGSGVVVATALIVVLWEPVQRSASTTRRKVTVGAMAIVMAAISVVLLLQTSPGRRLVNTFNLSSSATSGPAAAGGTSRARLKAWGDVTRYITKSPERITVGVGFGPDFFTKSGGAALVENGHFTDVRAPHNFWLNTWARLGAIGLAVEITVVISGWVLAVRRLVGGARGTVDLVAVMCLLAIPVAASFGVVLESPFGAVPYFWAFGVVLLDLRRGAATP